MILIWDHARRLALRRRCVLTPHQWTGCVAAFQPPSALQLDDHMRHLELDSQCLSQGNQFYNYLLKAYADATPNVNYLVRADPPTH